MKVLLVEPKSSTTYPPMGLMKFSRYHKLKGDEVSYVVGKDKPSFSCFWDKIYITSVFTYDFDNLIDTIQFYSENLFNFKNIQVGGIAATLLKDKIIKKTGVEVHSGLHNTPDPFLKDLAETDARYHYLLDCSPCIDNLPPDYEIVIGSTKYSKITDNSFFLFTTKGCPNSCSFCAVKTLEPTYVNYIPLKERIDLLRSEVGDRAGLLLLDNNIAASESFYKVISEIVECGYGVGEKMSYNKNGRTIYRNRFVDFNQGVDLRLLDKKKMKALSRIAINPLRLAFDNVGLTDDYKDKAQLAIACGINKLSNYMLYNYKDKPEDLYTRLEVNTDIVKNHGSDAVKIFSFPMRYSPIDRTNRTYVGKHWRRRQIRALQLILNATHGIVSHSLREYKDGQGFFYRAFGADMQEFIENLWMPFHYLINRDYFELDKKNIQDWRNDFRCLSKIDKIDFMELIQNGIAVDICKTKNRKILKILEHYEGEHTRVLQKESIK